MDVSLPTLSQESLTSHTHSLTILDSCLPPQYPHIPPDAAILFQNRQPDNRIFG
jgi:hypothetical protein